MKFTPNELKVIRAALTLAVHGDDSAWDELSSAEEDLAEEILDIIPETIGDDIEDEEDED